MYHNTTGWFIENTVDNKRIYCFR